MGEVVNQKLEIQDVSSKSKTVVGNTQKKPVSICPSVQQLPSVAKATILIRLYEDREYETKFDGDIQGRDIDIAIRAMMKGYRTWKNSQIKGKGV